MGEDAAARARRLAQQAWDSVCDRLPEQLGGVASPADARLARQLARDAERARRAHALAVAEHDAAVARRERLLSRSRRIVPTWTVLSGGSATAALVVADAPATPLLGVFAGLGAMRVALAVRRVRRPPPVPAPPPALQPAPPPPPHPRSAAFPVVRRLEGTRAALQSLLPLCSPATREAAEEAWYAAAEADTALRWQAARLAAAEPHRGVDPALLAGLEAGVTAQEGLVQAVADLVAACADPHGAQRLQDLTDRLHGLAAGLREVR
jgi:hypothetical protein